MTDERSPQLRAFHDRLLFERDVDIISAEAFEQGDIVGRYMHVLASVESPSPHTRQAALEATHKFVQMGGTP